MKHCLIAIKLQEENSQLSVKEAWRMAKDYDKHVQKKNQTKMKEDAYSNTTNRFEKDNPRHAH